MSQEYHILLVGRLTDPPESRKSKNLTAQYLVDKLLEADRCSEELIKVSKELHQYRDRIKASRNKLIAHRDLGTIRSRRKATSHPPEELHAFHSSLLKFCDLVAAAIEIDPLDFSSSSGKGDVLDLLRVLQTDQAES